MLNAIIRFSIKNKLIIGVFTLALICWGVYSLNKLPIDAVPDITNNQVQIITTAPSYSAQDIERLVTFPVEQTMSSIPDIEDIRSFSRFGLSVVTIVFKEDVDVYWARQQVHERLSEAKNIIPAGIGTPELGPVTTGLGEIYQYVVHTKKGFESKYDATSLRTIQDWIIRRQLLGTEGIADVSSFGGHVKQYEIAVNTEKIRSMNISMSEIFEALKNNNQNTGGAYIDKKPNAYFIRTEGLISSPEDITNIVVKRGTDGIPVLIRDIADVREGYATRYGAMTRNADGEVVGAIVMMLKGANSSKVIASVKKRIAEIQKTLPEGVVIEPFLDRTKLVNKAIGTVSKNLAEGALIVIFVLVLLLGNFRAGFIVASVIPLAMLFAISMMNTFGVSGNLMSLGAIDFGLIVDGTLIIVEATMHHLSLNKTGVRLSQKEMDTEVYKSASKIRTSAAFGEIIILMVYLPILALTGIEGKMFRPMAQTVSFAILGALILSVTYVPMISALALNKNVTTKRTISDKIMTFLQKKYRPLLLWSIRKRLIVVSTAIALFVLSLFIFNTMGAEFIPTLDEGDFAVETRVLTGSSLSETIDAATKSAEVLLANYPEVKQVVGKIGSGEIPTDPMPVEACDLMIILKDKSEWTSADNREELAEKMQETLEENIPGVTYGFQQPIQMRFNELMTGAKQDVVVKVYGENLDKLSAYSKQISKVVSSVDGAKDLYVEQVTGLPQIVVKYNREAIAKYGLNISEINSTINTAFAGKSTGFVYEGEKRFEMVVRLEQGNRNDIEDIKNLYITSADGNHVPLEQLADISFMVGPNQIQRDNTQRRITVAFNVRGRDVESIVEELQQKVDAQLKFAPGYYVTYGGTFENLQQAKSRLLIVVPIALLLIFLLLYLSFRSIKQSILIFSAIPLSAIGGIFALWIRDMPFSISAGVGFIALFGVAVLNGIVLIAEFNRLKKQGLSVDETILQGTRTRLRPVILTATVASLGFLPMALSASEGAEVQRPLATVVMGGLLTATVLTLIVLPCLYYYAEKIRLGKKYLRITTIILIVMTLPTLVQAQETKSLDELIELALGQNKTIQSNIVDVRYHQNIKKAAFELPKTDVSLLAGQYNSPNPADRSITVTQTIPFPSVPFKKQALGNSVVKQSEYYLETTKIKVIYETKRIFYQLSYLTALNDLLQEQDSVFREFANTESLKYKAGEGTLLTKTAAVTQRNQMKNRIQQNNTDIQIFYLQLKALLSITGDINVSYCKSCKLQMEPKEVSPSDNPNLRPARQEIEIAQQQKQLEIAKSLPDFNVGYFNQSLIGINSINGIDRYYSAGDRFQGIQLGVAIPIFYGLQSSKIKAASLYKEKVEIDFEQQKINLESDYLQMVKQHNKAKANLDYYESSAVPNANLIIKQAMLSYKGGAINYSEYFINVREAMIIKEAYLEALNQFNQSILKLNYLSGSK